MVCNNTRVEEVPAREAAMTARGTTTSDDSFDRRARVLVCEDSATTRKFLAWLLEPLYEVCLAPTGERAIAAAMEFLPDVILCDLMLPGIPGTEVYRRVRAIPAFEDVPFVIMTALEDDEGRTLGLESGADDYLRKPVNERELLARVASLVRLRRVTGSLRARNALLSRATAGGGGAELDVRRGMDELEARHRRFAYAVCALESPIAELGEWLSSPPASSREQALRALAGARGVAERMRALVAQRTKELPSQDFVEMLRSAIKEDEWMLYLHGAVMGLAGGFIHLALFG